MPAETRSEVTAAGSTSLDGEEKEGAIIILLSIALFRIDVLNLNTPIAFAVGLHTRRISPKSSRATPPPSSSGMVLREDRVVTSEKKNMYFKILQFCFFFLSLALRSTSSDDKY